MKQKVKPNFRATIDESCDNLSLEGLRTLVITQKIMNYKDFMEWEHRYREAQSDLTHRD